MYVIDYKAMGDRIHKKRKEMNLTQEKLAEMIDISISHMGEIERGKGVCSVEVLVNLATALDLNLDILVKGINESNMNETFANLINKVPKEKRELYINLCENIADPLK